MNGKLIFMRGPTSDYSYAIRLPSPQTDTIVQHEIANVSLVSHATAVEPTFDRSLCVEIFPGMYLGPEVEAVLHSS